MSRHLLCGGLVAVLAACSGSQPVTLVETLTCPAEPPPGLHSLPDRPNDLRDLHADRVKIEGLWAGAKERLEAYADEHARCQDIRK